MNSIGIIFALISNVIFGSLSDASHSRFGKRTPWIIIGGPIAGIGFYLTSISRRCRPSSPPGHCCRSA